jgi:hypothetical protein
LRRSSWQGGQRRLCQPQGCSGRRVACGLTGGAHTPSRAGERASRSGTSGSAMTNNNQPITNNFSAAYLTRRGNRADDIGSKLGARFALEFALDASALAAWRSSTMFSFAINAFHPCTISRLRCMSEYAVKAGSPRSAANSAARNDGCIYNHDELPFGLNVEASTLFFAPKGVRQGPHGARTEVISPAIVSSRFNCSRHRRLNVKCLDATHFITQPYSRSLPDGVTAALHSRLRASDRGECKNISP